MFRVRTRADERRQMHCHLGATTAAAVGFDRSCPFCPGERGHFPLLSGSIERDSWPFPTADSRRLNPPLRNCCRHVSYCGPGPKRRYPPAPDPAEPPRNSGAAFPFGAHQVSLGLAKEAPPKHAQSVRSPDAVPVEKLAAGTGFEFGEGLVLVVRLLRQGGLRTETDGLGSAKGRSAGIKMEISAWFSSRGTDYVTSSVRTPNSEPGWWVEDGLGSTPCAVLPPQNPARRFPAPGSPARHSRRRLLKPSDALLRLL